MSSGAVWAQVEDLFTHALERPEAERELFVNAARCSSEEIRSEVLKLLRARGRMGDFLQSTLLDFRGQLFGSYRALEEIGRGGMSVVYRGQRVDGDFDRRVAIKVVLVQAGPLAETRLLAALEHPNIARLLDAGTTELGFSYLVMEFVQGVACTKYAAASTEAEKLRLFLQVCYGVHAAHQALIVHRDLKPDNILVTAEGDVKLLDFGIGKLLATDGMQTVGARAYTIDYASPEQVLGHPASTAADVFSLGVVLCELLSGKLPRILSDLPLDVALTRLRDENPSLPLTGDLALIVRKAIHPDPGRRYSSAAALAADVERYLRHEAIEARPPLWWYSSSKFVRRHRYSVTVAALAVLSLAGTAAYALRQQRLAQKHFNDVRSLARAVMFDLHDTVSKIPGSLEARKQIADRSIVYLESLASDSTASADVQKDVAEGYLRLSDIEGKDTGGVSLGRSKEALQHAQKAVQIARRLVKSDPADEKARTILLDSLEYTETALQLRGEIEAAVKPGEEGVRIAEEWLARKPSSEVRQDRLAMTLKQLATVYFSSKQRDQSIPFYLRALELRQKLYDKDPASRAREQRLAELHGWLGDAYWFKKDYPNAEHHQREAMRFDEHRYSLEPEKAGANLSSSALNLAMTEIRLKQFPDAVAHIQRSLEIRRKRAAAEPSSANLALRVTAALDRLELAYREWGRYPEAIRAGEEALSSARQILKRDPANSVAARETIYSLVDLAMTYERSGQARRSCDLVAETLRYAPTADKGIHPYVDDTLAVAGKMAAKCTPAR